MNASYLITFGSIFDRKYFYDNMEKFFYYTDSKLDLKDFVVSHSNTFIEIKGKPLYLSYHAILENIPNTKIVKKLVKGKKISYIKLKKDSYLWLK